MRSYGNLCPPASSVSKFYPYSRRNPAYAQRRSTFVRHRQRRMFMLR